MKKLSMLIVDDDRNITKFVKANFVADGWLVQTANNGQEALQLLENSSPDIIILDVMMPVIDGFETCSRIRKNSNVPIIMLSARGSSFDKVQCLNLGADDYVTKPFDIEELAARIKAILKRSFNKMQEEIKHLNYGDICLNLHNHKAIVKNREVSLTPTEFALLKELIQSSDKVLEHRYLLSKIWGSEYLQDKEYLHVFINQLRKKIDKDSAENKHIITIPGVGYMLKSSKEINRST